MTQKTGGGKLSVMISLRDILVVVGGGELSVVLALVVVDPMLGPLSKCGCYAAAREVTVCFCF